MVVDLADPTRARATTTGGQLGHPASPHCRGQARLWVEDGYHSLLMDARDYAADPSAGSGQALEGDLTLQP
jgi:acyl-homoserine lactone acylase PvdQ